MPVYVLRAGDTDMVKIGWAIDVARRLDTLQTGHYEVLRVIRIIVTQEAGEKWLHQRFAEQRIRLEWFRFHPDMLTVEVPLFANSPDPMAPIREVRGLASEVAKGLGLSRAAISLWERVPAELVVDVERLSGIQRERLRPDLYRPEGAA